MKLLLLTLMPLSVSSDSTTFVKFNASVSLHTHLQSTKFIALEFGRTFFLLPIYVLLLISISFTRKWFPFVFLYFCFWIWKMGCIRLRVNEWNGYLFPSYLKESIIYVVFLVQWHVLVSNTDTIHMITINHFTFLIYVRRLRVCVLCMYLCRCFIIPISHQF